jgi:hypothetical protein
MSEEQDGLAMMQANMDALDSGEEIPHDEVMPESSEPESQAADSQDDAPTRKTGAKHMTKEEWEADGRDPDEYMSQDEFDRVADFKDESKLDISRKLARMEGLLKETVKSQSQMVSDAKEKARQEAIAELRDKQQEAIDDDDTKKALEIEREIQKETEKEKVEATPKVDQGMQEWYNNNKGWYGQDQTATTLINMELQKSEAAGIPFEEAIKTAEARAKKHFPMYFDDAPEQEKPAARPRQMTETSRKPARQTEKKKTFNDLPEEMRVIARKAAKASGLSEADYMEYMQ